MGYQAALIALSIIAIILLIPPLVWHIKTINIPAITLIVWLLLMDIQVFVNAIIWGGEDFANAYNGVGYCDVMVKLQVGASVGISSSVAAIMFNLYRILRADTVIPSLTSFRKIAVDLSISLITPVLVMALNYLVQSKRYYVFQYTGCQNILAPSYVTILVCTMWLVIWSLVGVIYAILIIFTFFKKRKDVKDILRCTNSGLNISRFSKLLSFCCIVILVMFPVSVYVFASDLSHVDSSYNFKMIHNTAVWFTVSFVPEAQPLYTVWIYIAISYIVFVFFGLGSDAIEMYLEILSRIGLGSVIEYFKIKAANRKILRADKMVSDLLNSNSIELKDTPISNIFADKNEIHSATSSASSNRIYNELDLDDDDVEYLKILYGKNKNDDEEKSPSFNYKYTVEY